MRGSYCTYLLIASCANTGSKVLVATPFVTSQGGLIPEHTWQHDHVVVIMLPGEVAGAALLNNRTEVRLRSHLNTLSCVLCLRYTFASGSADNIKQWMFPDGKFTQNLSGHNAIINTLAVNTDGVLVSGGNE